MNTLARLLSCLCLAGSMNAGAATSAQIDDARARGLAWLVKNQQGDGSWSAHDSIKVQSTAAALEALLNAGMAAGETPGAGVSWLASAQAASIDARAHRIAALAQAGMDTTALAQSLLTARPLTDRLVWGAYPQYAASFPDTPLGMRALRLSAYDYANRTTDLLNGVACVVLPGQRSDGGWAYVAAVAGAPDSLAASALMPTALTLVELAAQAAANNWPSLSCNGKTYTLATVLNNGVNFLLTRRNADNGFGEKGVSTALDTALAYQAIEAVNPAHTALAPAQDYLLTGAGKPGSDGSWGGDPLATAQVLKSLPAVVLPDGDGDGIPDAVEIALDNGSSASVADGRNAAPGNGIAEPGVNEPLLLPGAILGISYAYTLAEAGQTDFALVSGSLPPGLVISADGQLSGTPTQSGVYNFQYRHDGAQARVAQLAVSEQTNGDVPVLPAWGMAALGAALLSGVLRKRRQPD